MSLGESGGSEVDYETMQGRTWPTITQYSVFLENRVGQLLEIIRLFQGSKIKIVGLTISDSADCSILRLILSHPEQGREILTLNKNAFAYNELIVVELPSGPSSLADVCATLLHLDRPSQRPSRDGLARRQHRAGDVDVAPPRFRDPFRGRFVRLLTSVGFGSLVSRHRRVVAMRLRAEGKHSCLPASAWSQVGQTGMSAPRDGWSPRPQQFKGCVISFPAKVARHESSGLERQPTREWVAA